MRILTVRFKNLNSLAGEWEIDLTHPAFTADGIFAITGPTGAGKTTILDAICLALYGRTPRLARITRSGNEIISRQTGDCFAEVTFETQAGRFRCHWSQHRARKRADGELQAPKHEIAHADTGEIFEAKIKGVADKIVAATGMDFDRFTRSMLLAQGGFAAFLQASPDDRAPILEQITGTEIYSRISVRVHERRSGERKILDTLQAELAGMQLLGEEEERQLGAGLEQKSRHDAELAEQIALKSQAVAWLESIRRLEGELTQVARQREELQGRIDAFAPGEERLGRAGRALELAGDFAALTSSRREQESARQNRDACRESVPARQEAVQLAEEAMTTAVGRLDRGKAEQHAALPVIRAVRELDLKISGQAAPVAAARETIAAGEASLKALRARQHAESADLEGKRQALAGVLRQLDETRADEGLVEHLTGISGRCDAVRNLSGQVDARLAEISQAEGELVAATRLWQERSENLESRRRGLTVSRDAVAHKKSELQGILAGGELPDWRHRLAALTAHRTVLVGAREAAASVANSRQALEELGRHSAVLVAEASTLAERLLAQTGRQASLEQEVELLETQLSLLKKIEELEEARHQLQDGEPCPLCGATEHPFATGNIPAPDETRQRLSLVRGDLKGAMQAVSALKIRQAEVGKDREQAAARQREHAASMAEAETMLLQAGAELSLDAGDPDRCGTLEGLLEGNGREQERASRVVHAAEAAEQELSVLRESLEKAREGAEAAERETQSAAHRKESAGQLLQRLGKEAEALRTQREQYLGLLRTDVAPFGGEPVSLDNLEQIQAHLAARRAQWLVRHRDRSELEQQIAALEIQTRHRDELIRNAGDELGKQRGVLALLTQEREALQAQRHGLFGARNPDDEERRLSAAMDAADREVEAARRELSAANQVLGTLHARIAELETAITARGDRLKPAEEAFLARLAGAGFADEEGFTAACLPEEERTALAQLSRKLADEKSGLASKERETVTLLEAERRKQVTDQSRDELTRAHGTLVATQRELQQEIGALRQRLKDNDTLKQRLQERVRAIDAQKCECSRWDLLHELIGSADGKKYRNFAQGLTFEIMIGHANRQLQKMTDRYLLIRDDSHPLELNVVDNYQAGEVRSTKNLSGGEGFIVSLSLALGLSHMASKNVRVDSLFLDEGFGTLDEEALDTALETLAGLQQDGKLIGVISHVSALKERIGTRIQVVPRTGGRSLLSGPGCRRVRE